MSEGITRTVKVRCPSCNKKLGFPQAAVGRKAKCPGCQHVFRVADAASASGTSELPPSPAPHHDPDKVRVDCPSCGKRLTFLVSALGRRAKCIGCDHVFVVTAPEAAPAPVSAAAAPEPAAPTGDEPVDLFNDLAASEQNADLIALSPEDEALKVAAMTGPVLDASRPVKLDYTQEAGEYEQGIFGRIMGAMGPLAKGCALSLAGAVIGAIAWAIVGISVELELGYVAWLVGILAGLGMNWGTKSESALAGGIAAFFAFFGIFLGKILIIAYFVYPAIVYAKAQANPNSPQSKRVLLTEIRYEENMKKIKVKPLVGPTDKQEDEARDKAKAEVAAMSDLQVAEALEKHDMLEKRDQLVTGLTRDIIEKQRLDSPTQRQITYAQAEARQQVEKMSDAQVKDELKRREARAAAQMVELAAEEAREEAEAAEQEKADAAAGKAAAEPDAEEGEEAGDTGGGPGVGFWLFALGAFFGFPYGILFLLLAMGSAFKIGGYGLSLGQ